MFEISRIEDQIHQDFETMKTCPHGFECQHCPEDLCVKVVAVAELPTDFGQFHIIGFTNNKDGKDHTIVLKGEIGDGQGMLTRLHSACLTGDAFHSRRCDCGPQLRDALAQIEREGRGILLYHQAEGRGIGLANKLRAYVLQDKGLDTLDANTALGFQPDERDYRVPAEMFKKIGVKSLRLLTNNPEKVEQLQKFGIEIKERMSLESSTHEDNQRYLETKKERFGHWLHLER